MQAVTGIRCTSNCSGYQIQHAGEERGQILAVAEDFARAKGYEKAFVETTSWQAKPFYEKHGYDLLATLEGRPKGHSSHYLTNDLTRA